MIRRIGILVAILLAILPATVAARGPADGETFDTLIRVNGPVHIPAGETAQGVVVVSDDARIEGSIEFLVVIDGDATISGSVQHQVYIVNGTITLMDGARVGEEVLLYKADAVQQAGATVVGGVHDEWGGFTITRGLWFGLWLSMTVAVLATGLLFAAVGGRQLAGAAATYTDHAGATVLTTLIVWIGVPFLTVLLMATVVGIPLGIGILFFLLPALWFVGYLVAGAALGTLVVRARAAGTEHPYLPILVGLLIFQLVAMVPFIGGMVAVLAGMVGAGALVYRLWSGFRGVTAGRSMTTPTMPAAPTA